jgi:hypothetical protein
MESKRKRWLTVARWVARIWSLVPIAWSLAEVLFPHGGETVEVTLEEWITLALLGIAVVGLAVAWRWELPGGWISLGALAIFTVVFLLTVERNFPTVLIFLVAIGTPAVLFLVCGYASRTPARSLGA